MEELMKMIWRECCDRFGNACNVDIHVDQEGVNIITEWKGATECEDMPCFRINGNPSVRVDLE